MPVIDCSKWRQPQRENLYPGLKMGGNMDKRFKDESHRLHSWDYGWNGKYFVTICTDHHFHYFGKIVNHKMDFSEIGNIAQQCWSEIPQHFPFVKLGAWVVMPNHVHGIIIIDKPVEKTDQNSINANVVGTQNFVSLHSISMETSQSVSMEKSQPNPTETIPPVPPDLKHSGSVMHSKNKFGPQSQNLASIVRGFKAGVTKYATINHIPFKWQPGYYDIIIHDYDTYVRKQYYIENNPLKWNNDEFYH